MTAVPKQVTRPTLSDDDIDVTPLFPIYMGNQLSSVEAIHAGSLGHGTILESPVIWFGLPGESDSEASRALTRIATLHDNWDGHGALAAPEGAVRLARRIVKETDFIAPPTSVLASVNGGVLLEWESPTISMIVEVLDERAVEIALEREPLVDSRHSGDDPSLQLLFNRLLSMSTGVPRVTAG